MTTALMTPSKCAICPNEGSLICGQCFSINYCSREHQVQDWKSGHKRSCRKSWQVVRDEDVGRVMRLVQNVHQGAMLLKEKPLVMGPSFDNNEISNNNCLVCCVKIKKVSNEDNIKLNKSNNGKKNKTKNRERKNIDNNNKCSNCDWSPFCSSKCLEIHSSSKECELLRRLNNNNDDSKNEIPKGILTLIRCHLLEDCQLALLKNLESHLEQRLPTLTEQELQMTFLASQLTSRSRNELLNVICIFHTNAFSIANGLFVAIYPQAAMMKHSCSANARLHIDEEDFSLSIRASRSIKKQEDVTYGYINVLLPSRLRRCLLYAGKWFSCECDRCRDPTDFGSFVSALICKECKNQKVLPKNALDLKSQWICIDCGQKSLFEAEQIFRIELEAKAMLDEVSAIQDERVRLKALDDFATKKEEILGPNHALVLEAFRLWMSFCHFEHQEIAERALIRGRRVVEALHKIEKGALSTTMGLASYHLFRALMQCLSTEKRHKMLAKEAEETGQRALRVLAKENEGSQHRKMAKSVLEQLTKLKKI